MTLLLLVLAWLLCGVLAVLIDARCSRQGFGLPPILATFGLISLIGVAYDLCPPIVDRWLARYAERYRR